MKHRQIKYVSKYIVLYLSNKSSDKFIMKMEVFIHEMGSWIGVEVAIFIGGEESSVWVKCWFKGLSEELPEHAPSINTCLLQTLLINELYSYSLP